MRNSIHNVRKYFGHAMIVVVALFMALAAFPQTAQAREIYIPAVMTGASDVTQSGTQHEVTPVDPVAYSDWYPGGGAAAECAVIGDYDFAYKVDAAAPNGTYIGADGNAITISNSDGKVFDWSSNPNGIGAVIVKAATGANVWVYDPQVNSDTGLFAYDNKGVSHVTFCWNPEVTYKPLKAKKTAFTGFTRTYTWTIDKNVTPDAHSGFAGESFSSDYDVILDRSKVESGFVVTGTITVSNPNPIAVDFAVSDSVGGTAATVNCPVSSLPAYGSTICTYSAALGDTKPANGTNTATITSNTAGVQGTTASAPYTFGSPTTTVGYATVNVTDSVQGTLGSTSGDFTFEYKDDFACPTDASLYTNGVHTFQVPNTATIVETGQSADADVTVTCYAPVVTKDATASYDETHIWSIVKTVNPTSQSGIVGDVLPWTWTVVVSETPTDDNFAVSGTIFVKNPSPDEPMTVNVADTLNDGATATVDCGNDSTSLTVAAGETSTCSYSASPTGKAATLNTATATLNGAGFSGTAPVTFVKNVIGGTATVTDDEIGLDESLTAGEGPWTRTGDDSHTCSTNPDDYGTDGSYSGSVPNTATVVASNEQTDESSATTAYTCYAPVVTKDATASYDETHIWEITKSVNPVSQSGIAGDILPWTWTVVVSETSTDDNFAVSGTIFVKNPSTEDSMTVNVADTLNDGATATVDCGNDSTSLTVAAGETSTCSYSASPTGKTATLNTATATLNGASFSGTAPVTFVKNVIGGTATVTDDEIGLDESLTASEGPWTRTGDDSHTCSTNPDDYGTDDSYSGSVPNTATVVASNEQTDESSATTAYTCYIQTPELAGLGDLVWDDTDKDGVQDAGEVGVPNVTVNLLDTGGNVLDTTTTDANGLYSFINLTPGSYVVEFVKPAGTVFSPQNQGGDPAKDSNADTTTGKSGIVTLVGGQFDGTIDAGIFTPAPPPELAGLGNLVWNDTNQNGVQDAGEVGVPNVTVNLLDTVGNVLDTTTTDANGLYTFINLTPGSYVVEFVKPAGTLFSPQNQGVDDAIDSDADTTTGKSGIVTLVGGQFDDTIDAGISTPTTPPVSTGLGNRVWYDTNANGVQDAGELSVPNFTVNLLDTGGNVLATTKTDANGLYTFTNLLPGSYVVEFVKPADTVFSPQNQGGDPAKDSNADTTTGKSGIVTLVGGQFDDTIDAGIYTPASPPPPTSASLGNLVWNDTNQNGVQDAGEVGVPNVTVNLLDTVGNVLDTTTTDANGLYTFTNLLPGSYVVEFVKPGSTVFSPQNQGSDPTKDSNADTTTGKSGIVTLVDGQFDDTIDAGIHTPESTPELASLGDRVWFDTNKNGLQDAGEVGVPGVLVTLYNSSDVALATDTTDADGYYLFEKLAPGSYYVIFAKPQGFTFTQYDVNGNGKDAIDSDAQVPALKVTVATPAAEVKLGDKLQYTLSYSNTGQMTAVNVVLSTTVPAGTTFLPLESPGWVCEGNQTSAGTRCTFAVAQLAPSTPAQTLFVVQLGTDDVQVPAAIKLAVTITQETPGQTAPVTLVGGDQNLTLDAGIYPLEVTMTNTPRRPGPTSLDPGAQPLGRVKVYLPAVQN